MKKHIPDVCLLVMSLILFSCRGLGTRQAESAVEDRPNILLILCDDLGYGDVGFNGAEDIRTPHLDSLARNGVVFSSAYVAHPFCGPSRAALMTGRYSQSIGTPYNMYERDGRTDDGVPVSEVFMSRALQDAGYFTAAVGKWHMGFSPRFHPNSRGFDEYYGFLGGGHEYFPEQFAPKYLKQKEAGNQNIWEYLKPLVHNSTEVNEEEYITDALSRETVGYIHQAAAMDDPFFIYLAYNAPHVPLQAREEDMAQFPDIENEDRRKYAGMVYAVDRGVGDIVHALQETGQVDNTLIVFFSDNGGHTGLGATNAPLQGSKGDSWEGGFRTPMFFHYPDLIKGGSRFDIPVSALDLYPTFTGLAGAELAEGKVLDGEDIMDDVIEGKDNLKDRPIYVCRYRDDYVEAGARMGEWKLTRMKDVGWKLYRISEDPGESTDLAKEYPHVMEEMMADMYEWTRGHVQPLWGYTPEDEEMWRSGILPDYETVFNPINN